MRGAFIRTLVELARDDPRILLLTGDLGFAAVEPFAEAFPERFYNVGVAEQNMVGIATGLADASYLPFVYSIASFATRRPFEFILCGPILNELPVRIVGIGGGFEYGHAGPTHHAVDDVALMRALPGIAIISPADYAQTETALRKTWDFPGPVYYRLGKDDSTVVSGLAGEFEIGRVQYLREGSDLAIIAMGSVATEAVAAAAELERRGVDTSVGIVASVRPEPIRDLCATLSRVPLVLTVEAHSVDGGLGSLVAELIAEQRMDTRLVRNGVRSGSNGVSGSNSYWNARHGLTCSELVDRALTYLNERRLP